MPHNLLGLCTYLSEYMRTPLFPPIKFHQTFWIWLNAAVVTTGRALRELLNLWYHFWKLILLLLICFLGFCMCGFDGGKLFVQFSRTNLLCMKVLLPEVTWSDRFVVSCYTETRGSFKQWRYLEMQVIILSMQDLTDVKTIRRISATFSSAFQIQIPPSFAMWLWSPSTKLLSGSSRFTNHISW